MSSDDSRSAKELRAMYGPSGSVPDSQLSASQLRARAGIASNSKDFSTRREGGADSSSGFLLISFAVAVVAVIAYVLWGAEQAK